MAEDKVITAGEPTAIRLHWDRSGRDLKADGADKVFLYASITDSRGNTCYLSNARLNFSVSGNGQLVGGRQCRLNQVSLQCCCNPPARQGLLPSQ
ncbi:hypothetical protein FSB84_20945 [Pseudobacter ginsenosidimutans]|uniref:hypothetical protein n=1 Tax=Pseudobacter ginsenosidimutans TaxID=661488 RepID=UPI0011BB65AB|nr:hypothetical protein [Pseudobacter ginsenosidimutans]QEC44025.1 hypothetical protein FSB84_20945 [Pseudobacter ginsenosidimutans]